jgi:hypothetical protein
MNVLKVKYKNFGAGWGTQQKNFAQRSDSVIDFDEDHS